VSEIGPVVPGEPSDGKRRQEKGGRGRCGWVHLNQKTNAATKNSMVWKENMTCPGGGTSLGNVDKEREGNNTCRTRMSSFYFESDSSRCRGGGNVLSGRESSGKKGVRERRKACRIVVCDRWCAKGATNTEIRRTSRGQREGKAISMHKKGKEGRAKDLRPKGGGGIQSDCQNTATREKVEPVRGDGHRKREAPPVIRSDRAQNATSVAEGGAKPRGGGRKVSPR